MTSPAQTQCLPRAPEVSLPHAYWARTCPSLPRSPLLAASDSTPSPAQRYPQSQFSSVRSGVHTPMPAPVASSPQLVPSPSASSQSEPASQLLQMSAATQPVRPAATFRTQAVIPAAVVAPHYLVRPSPFPPTLTNCLPETHDVTAA